MPNQTPHTPIPGLQIRPERSALGVKPPVITKEMQRLVEENRELIKTALPAIEANERRREEERLKQNQTRQFTWNPEALELSWLEPFNFQVDSSNWWYELDKNWKRKMLNWFFIKENPEKDIWEITMNIWWITEQLFTQDSAIRETKKAWKTMPSGWEWWQWEQICKPYWDDWEKLSKELWLTMAGLRNMSTGLYGNQSAYGDYWCSSPSASNGFNLYFNSANVRSTSADICGRGFSVRCFREWFKPETEAERKRKDSEILKKFIDIANNFDFKKIKENLKPNK